MATTKEQQKKKKPGKSWTRFDEARQAKYFESLRTGISRSSSAGMAGVAYNTVRTHRQKNPEFAMMETEAYEAGLARIEAECMKRAYDPKKASDTMLIWVSKNRLGWHDRQHVQHEGGVTVNIGNPAGLGMAANEEDAE